MVPTCQPSQSECLPDTKFLAGNIQKQIWISMVPLCQPRQSECLVDLELVAVIILKQIMALPPIQD